MGRPPPGGAAGIPAAVSGSGRPGLFVRDRGQCAHLLFSLQRRNEVRLVVFGEFMSHSITAKSAFVKSSSIISANLKLSAKVC
jgi:hypothetical protein